jgi:hypothetical protein
MVDGFWAEWQPSEVLLHEVLVMVTPSGECITLYEFQ